MGQDTYRLCASARFPLYVTMVTFPIFLPSSPPVFKPHTLAALLQVMHLNALMLLLFCRTNNTSCEVSK